MIVYLFTSSTAKLAGAFGLSASKSWYAHYFNTKENLNYVGPIPDVSNYDVNEMSEAETADLLEWYEGQKSEIFYNRRVLESYCLETSVSGVQAGIYADWKY